MTAAAQMKEKANLNVKKFLQGDLRPGEFAIMTYRIDIPEGWTLEDILRPECWANIGAMLKDQPFPKIECIWQDGSRFVELIVISADRLWAKVHVLRDVDLTKSMHEARHMHEAVNDPRFKIIWKGPSAKYSVIRLSDNTMIHSKAATTSEANAWLTEHIKNLG